jgi:outer membrane receptor protein involved in Fe transport
MNRTSTQRRLCLGLSAALLLAAAQPARGEPARRRRQRAAAAPAEVTSPPVVLRDARADYPADALRDRVRATVVFEIEISASGEVSAADLLELHAEDEAGTAVPADRYPFAEAARIAVHELRFRPAEAGGKPVAVRVRYTYRFTLPAPPASPGGAPAAPGGGRAAASAAPPVAPAANLVGVVRERGTRREIAGATVTVYRGRPDEGGFEATTDAAGRFRFHDLAEGTWILVIELDGYARHRTAERIDRGAVLDGVYYLEKNSYSPYDVVVEASTARKEVTRRTLEVAELVKIPGTLGDPVLAVENLPGVARTASEEIVIRGSGPEDTGVYLGGIRIPFVFHPGFGRSVIPAAVVEKIELFPGSPGVYYGRSTGGVYEVSVKRLRPDRLHGSLDTSVIDTSLYLEVPLGSRAAIALAVRRSYLDLLLQAAIPDDTPVDFETAPRYYDYQLLGNWTPGGAHELRWMLLGADDGLELLFDDPSDLAGPGVTDNAIALDSQFQRLMLEHRFTPAGWLSNRLQLAAGRDAVEQRVFGQFVDFATREYHLRNTTTARLGSAVALTVGLDTLIEEIDAEARTERPGLEGEGTSALGTTDALYERVDGLRHVSAAAFAELQLVLGWLAVTPGVRVDHFAQVDTYSADPRLVVRLGGPRFSLKGGVGVVHQPPQVHETLEVFGNPALGLERALQYSAGLEWRPREHLALDLTVFHKGLDRLVGRSHRPVERGGVLVEEVYSNDGTGTVRGLEMLLEHQLRHGLRGWIAYTLSRAERTDPGSSEARLFDHDQTHILAAVLSYALPRHWELGLRWRYVTGAPFTPVAGSVFNSDQDRYDEVPGRRNSERLPAFHQLDLRVDKSWIYDTWRLSAYLSLANAYNQRNAESVSYNFDYSERKYTRGLPLLPILGIRADF